MSQYQKYVSVGDLNMISSSKELHKSKDKDKEKEDENQNTKSDEDSDEFDND